MRINSLTLVLAIIFTFTSQAFSQKAKIASSQNHWKSIGPDGGLIRQLIAAPSNKEIVYVVAEGGTIFRSTNKGNDWEIITSFPSKCTFIAINSLDSNILFAVSDIMGLLKTTDNGKNWIPTGWKTGSINCLEINPANPNIMYLATNKSGGIYKSVDSGDSWTFSSFHENLDLGITYVIKIDPQHNNIVYALSWKLYRSSDYGDTWETLLGINGTFTNFDIDPNNSRKIFVTSSEGIYKSNDGGKTYSLSNNGDIDPQHPWTDFILVNPYDSNLVYRSTNHMAFISIDGGDTWRSTAMHATSFTMPTNNVLLSGSRDGIYAANENCENIRYSCNGLHGTRIKSITSDPFNSYKVLTLTEDQGIAVANLFVTNSEQVRWQKTKWGQGASEIKIHPVDNQLIFGGFDWARKSINKSTDGGNTWYLKNIDDYIISFAVDPANPNIIFAGGLHGLHKSTNLGETWQKVTTPDTSNFLGYSEFKHISVAKDTKTIFLASSYGYDWSYRNALLKTTDYGQTWTENNLRASSVVVFPDDPNIILCGQSTHIYRSSDSGNNWEIVDSGFTNVSINNFQLLNENSVTVATSNGVYYSSDKGKTWFDFSVGLGNLNIQCLSLSKKPIPTLFAGTSGGGIYSKIIDNILSVEPNKYIIQEYRLFNNFPNPFNPITTIKFSIPNSQFATLKVYDMLGREVATLVNEEKSPGTYEVKFDGGNLSSGIYFYRLQAGNFSETKKLVLMK